MNCKNVRFFIKKVTNKLVFLVSLRHILVSADPYRSSSSPPRPNRRRSPGEIFRLLLLLDSSEARGYDGLGPVYSEVVVHSGVTLVGTLRFVKVGLLQNRPFEKLKANIVVWHVSKCNAMYKKLLVTYLQKKT